jgi:Tol biopolymer transport system component
MPVGNRATHETWSDDGEKMFYFKKGNGYDGKYQVFVVPLENIIIF